MIAVRKKYQMPSDAEREVSAARVRDEASAARVLDEVSDVGCEVSAVRVLDEVSDAGCEASAEDEETLYKTA